MVYSELFNESQVDILGDLYININKHLSLSVYLLYISDTYILYIFMKLVFFTAFFFLLKYNQSLVGFYDDLFTNLII